MADSASIAYSTVYAGTSTPGGPPPWLNALFEDIRGGSDSAVRVTFDVSGLVSREYVSSFYFNFRESINPGSVTVTDVATSNFSGTPTFVLGQQNDQNAGSGYRFDFEVDLPTAQTDRMTDGSRVSFVLNRSGGINIYDLLVTTLSNSQEASLSVAHILALADGSSVWVSAGDRYSLNPGTTPVPEPGTVGAVAVAGGLLAWQWARRRTSGAKA